MLSVRLGWRNLWRNPRRSVITGLAISAALVVLMILIALLAGLRDQLLRNGTELLMSHMQLHHSAYLPDRHIADTLPVDDLETLLASLEAHAAIEAASPRVRAHALLSSREQSAGAQLLGIDPRLERAVTVLLERQVGETRDPQAGEFGMLLGATLARELEAEPGTELAVVTQAADGSLGNELFTVTGVLRTGARALDQGLAVVHIEDLRWLLVLGPDDTHEVAMIAENPHAAEAAVRTLAASGLLPEDTHLRPWSEIAPQLRDYITMNEGASRFLVLIVALFAAFGVMNSMLMAVHERMREFGTLNALGARPALILLSLTAEAMLLALLGLALGLGAGMAVTFHMVQSGWDLTRWTGELSMMDTHLDPVLHGAWVWPEIASAAVGLAVATLLAVLLAAARIVRLDPVRAMSAPTEG